MKQNNLITALVITGMTTQWARYYIRKIGFSNSQTESILDWISENLMVTGNIIFCQSVLDGYSN
jgi:hypothetical protein